MRIAKKEMKPGVAVLELSGPLQMGVECKQLELAFDELLRENRTRVVLDLSGVTKLDSSGFGRIVNCFSRVSKAGGSIRLAGVPSTMAGVLKTTHADRFLKVYATAAEASESFLDSAERPAS